MSDPVLIVNADDFGRSPAVNRGVIRCHDDGIVTSATLMVRWPDAVPAAGYARTTALAVGLHLDLGEWVYRDDAWSELYQVVDPTHEESVRDELGRQLEAFGRLMGRPPTHLDSHQHVHRDQPVRAALLAAGERLGVPVRHFTEGITYCGAFFGQDGKGNPYPDAITAQALVAVIQALPPGVTELACHPAAEAEGDSAYDAERVVELESLCDPRVRDAIERRGVLLRSFATLERETAT